ncbi:hypothetical protein PVAR5_4849 [Paecilomyces variotii No. 5]|uniref:Uncharacterized protein n=1 Tax=Byssochlamys spectabilis (strain No. 5 / NBRC 109023) TaxID=1356009 RepID=V5FF75_BYSSN|nr:hypothetical protein PVAR5_4849 [Paecilomyces variotii No. 5]
MIKDNHSDRASSVHRSQDPRRSSSFLQVEATGLIGANIESDTELKSSMCNPRLATEFELISTQVLVSDIVDVRERPRGINNGDAGLAIGSEAEKGRASPNRLDVVSGPSGWFPSTIDNVLVEVSKSPVHHASDLDCPYFETCSPRLTAVKAVFWEKYLLRRNPRVTVCVSIAVLFEDEYHRHCYPPAFVMAIVSGNDVPFSRDAIPPASQDIHSHRGIEGAHKPSWAFVSAPQAPGAFFVV